MAGATSGWSKVQELTTVIGGATMLGGNVRGIDRPGWVFVSPVDESLAIRSSHREDGRVMSQSVWIPSMAISIALLLERLATRSLGGSQTSAWTG
jgi:hypothetical protein